MEANDEVTELKAGQDPGLPSYPETVLMVNQHRLTLQGLSITLMQLMGQVEELAFNLELLLNAVNPPEVEPLPEESTDATGA